MKLVADTAPAPPTVQAHHVEEGRVYRATLDPAARRVLFEVRFAGEYYEQLGSAEWCPKRGVVGTNTSDPRVVDMMRNFTALLRGELEMRGRQ